MKILYVENHPAFVAAVTREFLRDHEVDVIPTVEGAKQRSIEQYDLILCDYDLDDGKRSEYIQHLRTFNSTVLVIAVSSHSRGNELMIEAGANAVCKKVEFKKLNGIISELDSSRDSNF